MVQLLASARGSAAAEVFEEDCFGRIFPLPLAISPGLHDLARLPKDGEGLWRLDKAVAGGGVTRDLAHNIDVTLWLNGPITEVAAMTETFVKERKPNPKGKVEPVTMDDAGAFRWRFENDSTALFEATCYARVHGALFRLEINGERASASWDLHDLNGLNYFDHRDGGQFRGWKSIHITDGDHPHMRNRWVPGLHMEYEPTFIQQVGDFILALGGKCVAAPTFGDGLASDYVPDRVLKSAKTKGWEKVAAA